MRVCRVLFISISNSQSQLSYSSISSLGPHCMSADWFFLSTFSDCWVCPSGSSPSSAYCPVYEAPPSKTWPPPPPPGAQPAFWFAVLGTLLVKPTKRNPYCFKIKFDRSQCISTSFISWLPILLFVQYDIRSETTLNLKRRGVTGCGTSVSAEVKHREGSGNYRYHLPMCVCKITHFTASLKKKPESILVFVWQPMRKEK